MKTYELTYIVSDALNDEASGVAISQVNKQIEQLGGVIIKEEPWGKRRLAYPINKRTSGYYVTLQTHLDGQKIAELERFFRLHEAILRYLIIHTELKAIKPTDEAEVSEALDKRVEQKITDEKIKVAEAKTEEKEKAPASARAKIAKTDERDEEKAEEKVEQPEVTKPKRTARAKVESDSKEESDAERKKMVEEKLSQLLNEDTKE